MVIATKEKIIKEKLDGFVSLESEIASLQVIQSFMLFA